MFEWLLKALTARRDKLVGARARQGPHAPAYSAYEAGDWTKAVALLQPLALERPDDAETQYRLGDALYQLNRHDEALPLLERAVDLNGGSAAYFYKLGNVLKELARPIDALACYRAALRIDPRHARAYNNAGAILEQDKPEKALEYYHRALEADAGLLAARSNLAVLLHRLGRYAEAAAAYQPLLKAQPDSPGDWCNLGNAYQGMGRYEDAVRCYERALALDPASAEPHLRSGIALLSLEKYTEAEAAARRAAHVAPTAPQSWVSLGNALEAQKRLDDALGAYRRGLELDPNLPELLNNIGAAYRQKGDLRSAWRYFERAVEAAPGLASARINLANARYSLGYVDEALERHRAILEDDPDSVSAARQILMILMYQPGLSSEALFEEHRAFARKFPPRSPVALPSAGTARSGGKLRIGYVSSDFRRHPVGYNMMPVVEHHDRGAFEIYLYSAGKSHDEVTQHFRRHADAWRPIAHLPDEDAARMMREDRLDLLVLLAGRFDENRPLLASYRAAPVQVSMHDTATSGLEEVDYLIADRNLSPSDTPERYTERVACLPTFYLHAPLELPPPSPPPVARSGSVTFGSFNNPAKINAGVVSLWARVLHGVPGSRLLLKFMDVFGIDEVRARYLSLFEGHGISAERLVLPAEGVQDRHQHLARYGQIDIALDTFPFSGSTTTFEALSMGVPVVTLVGDRMVARWSAAMLRKVGLSRLVAKTEAEYVELAAKLAANPEELARLRAELRERVPRSPLCAVRPRVRQLERLYRAMWARHAARRQ
jgi:protein O-GlcNAc transferase